ncbi:MAG: translation initiation factor IF-2 [Patescibacteria group bacterium]
MKKRNPIVVVLGHVDHGKTTLLDAIRKTSVASREAGGITQSIGASVVNGICFIDTPGHAAFGKMRGRGTRVADIAILVVSADDGIKPQTKEALEMIKEAKIPFIVALTKIDIVGVRLEIVRGQLEKEGLLFEGREGEVPLVSLSAKTGEGLKNLLETITLLSEVNNVSGDLNAPLEAVIIESFKDARGPVTNIIVRNGNIKVGDQIDIDNLSGKVRGIFNDKGESVREVLPGEPSQVIGLTQKQDVGPRKVLGDARRLAEDELPIVLKAANSGILEAIIASLPPKVIVVDYGIGDVLGNDILTAKVGNAYVFAFGTKIPNNIAKLAETEGVRVKKFDIIYELISEIEETLKGGKVQILGKAQVLASFPFNKKSVAGCRVLTGRFNKGDRLILTRDEKEIGKAKALTIKKQKVDTTSVGANEEFGVILEPQLDFQVNDVLLSVTK